MKNYTTELIILFVIIMSVIIYNCKEAYDSRNYIEANMSMNHIEKTETQYDKND
tara:strand:- start:991 stop:1152 length:162 start_codon:yes stop_codon:yes gene_type:complete